MPPRRSRGNVPAPVSVRFRAIEAARDRERPPAQDVSAETADGAGVSAETPDRTLGERDADALVLLADESLAASGHSCRSAGERYQVVVHVDEATLRSDDGGRADLDGGEPIAGETARRVCCDASLVALVERDGRPVSVGRKTRKIPPSLRRALRSRDGGCQFPGCTQHRWVDAHHIEHWVHGGETKLGNLIQLCRHHHRLVHEGGFVVEGRPGRNLRFRSPDGRVLRRAPRPPRRSDPGCVPAANRRRGVEVTPTTCLPGWAGERLDLGLAVEAVLSCAAAPSRRGSSPRRSPLRLLAVLDAAQQGCTDVPDLATVGGSTADFGDLRGGHGCLLRWRLRLGIHLQGRVRARELIGSLGDIPPRWRSVRQP